MTGSTAAGSAVAVNSGGTLGGNGTVNGAVTVATGGSIQPGSSSIGTLSTGAVTVSGGVYGVDLNGTTPTYDQINSSGTVALGSSVMTLTISSFVNSSTGKVYTIVNAATAITGTFKDKPEGSLISLAGRSLRVSYTSTAVTLTDLGARSDNSLLLMFSP